MNFELQFASGQMPDSEMQKLGAKKLGSIWFVRINDIFDLMRLRTIAQNDLLVETTKIIIADDYLD